MLMEYVLLVKYADAVWTRKPRSKRGPFGGCFVRSSVGQVVRDSMNADKDRAECIVASPSRGFVAELGRLFTLHFLVRVRVGPGMGMSLGCKARYKPQAYMYVATAP